MVPEKEISVNETYQRFLQASLTQNDFPLDKIEEFIAGDLVGYGTALNEKIMSLADYRALVIRQREQAEGTGISFQFTPVLRRIAADGNAAVFIDEVILTMHIEAGTHQLFLRFTTVFEYIENTWKAIHFHASAPVETNDENDTWHVDEWKARNLVLEKMVAEKTADLEIKNKELEIEAALERVRAASMAMIKSEHLLDVITVVAQQLEKLGIQFDLTNFRVNEGEKDWDIWIYGKWMDWPMQWYVPYFDHPYFHMKSIDGQVTSEVFTKEDMDSFAQHLLNQGLVEAEPTTGITAEQQKARDSAKGFAWSIARVKGVSLNIANNYARPYTEEENSILMRFTIVFEQVYTRFLDLQKAEEQSREAQIELSLERVRARAMAMQNSEELKDLIGTVFLELTKLDVVLARCLIMIYDPETKGSMWWMANSEAQQEPIGLFVQYHEHTPYLAYIKAWQDRVIRWQYELHGQLKKDWDDYLFVETELNKLPDFVIAGMKAPERVWLSSSFNNFGNLTLATLEPLPAEHFDILLRFAKVFDLTYTRFNDLQKAEEQAREAQIEAALERVRSRTMGMQKSNELREVIQVIYEQFQHLNFQNMTAGFLMDYRETNDFNVWLADPYQTYKTFIHYPYFDHPIFNRLIEAKENGLDFFTNKLTFEEKKQFLDHGFKYLPAVPPEMEQLKETVYNSAGYAISTVMLKNVMLFIENFEGIPFSDAENAILMRFGKVFEQTYTRFNDLKQAEGQAREAQIELALERVRAKMMAIQHPDEFTEVIYVIGEQFLNLGIDIDWANFSANGHEFKDGFDLWSFASYAESFKLAGRLFIPWADIPVFQELLEGMRTCKENGSNFYVRNLSCEARDSFLDHITANTNYKEVPQEYRQRYYARPGGFISSTMIVKDSWMAIGRYNGKPFSEEQNAILIRFGNAFDQAYTRFLDLQKAEEQAREAQIETGLERVRYSAMAMQSTEDVGSATAVVFNEISLLGVEAMRCGITIIHPDKTADVWAATTTSEGKEMKGMGRINFNDHPLWVGLFDAWENKEENFTYALKGDDLKSYYKILANSPNYNSSYIQKQEFPDHVFYASFFEQGAVFTFSLQPHNDEKRKVLKRFTAVFSLTFRRYLDLKQAEAQAREAEIQLALERVRARTMAMQRSEELAETCELLFEEYRKLNIVKADHQGPEDRATIGIFNEANGTYDLWVTDLKGKKLDHTYRYSLDEPINIAKAYAAWKEGKPSLVIDMHGDELNQWLNHLQSIGLPVNADLYNKRRINTWVFFSKGNLGISTNEPLPEESVQLLQRFADTFNLTYTRFQDLKDAESRTQIAVKEASLDRVRAEIASMRTAEDLQRITPLVWRELTVLGVPFFRCGVFIVDDEEQKIHFYLSAPDGKPLAALALNIDTSDVTKNATTHWREQKVYISHWSKEEFLQFARNLVAQGHVQNVNTYQGGEEAPGSLSLQFIPFAQGMMYVGSAEDLLAPQIELVQALADAFSTAYARYEDFNKLEAAKQQIESTLKDLRATQTQLIQSEKMASLGELTAGIAHEIQNPLNFVNNFSEVSTELVDEMNEEIQKGNLEDAQQIASDLKENLSKINHHGKRAGDIVRSMLQHSRSSSGQKELTDINALADEYLRLAYHGLRAKDKSFNATMKTDFDALIGTVNIIPQDIGRVILNLITNAFYAVDEKKKQTGDGFEPTVAISTRLISASRNPSIRQSADSIIISVKDNGNGIPQKVLDKIFQPFFTTKPTGQGTGLGLSLSYDIVKAHGGELSVETIPGEETTFTIHLPNQS